jgi:hypothetical protein
MESPHSLRICIAVSSSTPTAIHCVSDIQSFLRWFGHPPVGVQRTDLDRFIVW